MKKPVINTKTMKNYFKATASLCELLLKGNSIGASLGFVRQTFGTESDSDPTVDLIINNGFESKSQIKDRTNQAKTGNSGTSLTM